MRHLGIIAVVLSAILVVCMPVAGHADNTPSTAGWTINPVVDASGVHISFGIDNAADLATWQGALTKTWGDPTLSDPTKYIALGDSGLILRSLSLTYDGDPVIGVSFDVENTNDFATPCTFTKPAVVYSLPSAKGVATAAVTVTDCDGDGATATGAFDGAFYRAFYNTLGTEQTFKYLVTGPIVADPFGSSTKSQTYAPWHGLNGPVSDIKAEFGFTISAHDSASGTSSFTVVSAPEPGTIAGMLAGMVGLGGILLRRKRA